jgi:hypothetical protein
LLCFFGGPVVNLSGKIAHRLGLNVEGRGAFHVRVPLDALEACEFGVRKISELIHAHLPGMLLGVVLANHREFLEETLLTLGMLGRIEVSLAELGLHE